MAKLRKKAKIQSSPPLYQTNNNFKETINLARSQINEEFLEILYKRRTVREFSSESIGAEKLGLCVFNGLGITAFVESPYGKLPLKMTPSGGARNPFEAYIYALNVQKLKKGFYHYSALENSLGFIETKTLPGPDDIIAGQEWGCDVAALIILVANFERTMWKYEHPNAYRVVLIEAGHISQNILLTATYLGLSAAPTAAIADTLIEKVLGLNCISQSAVFVIGIGNNKK